MASARDAARRTSDHALRRRVCECTCNPQLVLRLRTERRVQMRQCEEELGCCSGCCVLVQSEVIAIAQPVRECAHAAVDTIEVGTEPIQFTIRADRIIE